MWHWTASREAAAAPRRRRRLLSIAARGDFYVDLLFQAGAHDVFIEEVAASGVSSIEAKTTSSNDSSC
jgi:hypothetical protein